MKHLAQQAITNKEKREARKLQAVSMWDAGEGYTRIAVDLDVSEITVRNYLKEAGRVQPRPQSDEQTIKQRDGSTRKKTHLMEVRAKKPKVCDQCGERKPEAWWRKEWICAECLNTHGDPDYLKRERERIQEGRWASPMGVA